MKRLIKIYLIPLVGYIPLVLASIKAFRDPPDNFSIGIVFIMQPEFIFGGEDSETNNIMFYVAIVGVLLGANTRAALMVAARMINSSVNLFTINATLGPSYIVFAGFLWYVILQSESNFTPLGLLLIGIGHGLGYLSIGMVYISLRFENPSMIAILCYSQILFTYIGEVLFFGVDLGLYDVLGATILTASCFGFLLYSYCFNSNKKKSIEK